jgi:light-regulated signal transduction histidine kinase (bacteriophytochrome)
LCANEDLVLKAQKKKRAEELINKQRIRSLAFVSSHDLQEPLRKIQILQSDTNN